MGTSDDVDAAVAAARQAFPSYSTTPVEERVELLRAVAAGIREREPELAEAITTEMGAPRGLALALQAPAGRFHFNTAAKVLANFEFEQRLGTSLV